MNDFITLACIMLLAFVAAPCVFFGAAAWPVNSSRSLACLGIAGGILVIAFAWFHYRYRKWLATVGNVELDQESVAEGQRLTRGERRVTCVCLAVAAFFVGAAIDLRFQGIHGWAAVIWPLYLVPLPFLTFGFAAVVATHGKWKLTLAALGCFAASVFLSWVGLFNLWGT